MGVYNSLRVSLIEKPLLTLMNFIGIISISRILSPDEIGIQVLTVTVVSFASELKNFGVGSFLIRQKTLTQETISSTFTLSMLSSFMIGAALFFLAPQFGQIFNDGRVADSLEIISFSFYFVPFVAVITAVLTRNFEFKKLAINRVSEVFSLQACAIALASAGVGYISLAIAVLVSNVVSLLIFIYHKPTWFKWRINFLGVKSIFKSNIFITLSAGIRRLIQVLPEMLVGVYSNSTNTAYYSRGVGVVNFGFDALLSFLSPVIAPYLSRENKLNSGAAKAFVEVNKIVGVLSIPLLIGISLLADSLVGLMFGSQWMQSGNIASVIAISILFKNIYLYFNDFLITIGKEKHLTLIQMLELLLICLGCIYASHIDWSYIPMAILVASFVMFIVKTIYLHMVFGLLYYFFANNIINLVIGMLVALVVYFAENVLTRYSGIDDLSLVAIVFLSSFGAWSMLVWRLNHPLKKSVFVLFRR